MVNPPSARRAVLALDAAWTATQPTGVALVHEDAPERWRCAALAPCYPSFQRSGGGVPVDWSRAGQGSEPDADKLLSAARLLLPAGAHHVITVSVDMPVAKEPILGRRRADNEIATRFGGAGCGTHSPTPSRPGRLSRVLADGFLAAGLDLAVAGTTPAAGQGYLVEVYPHPAILSLLGITYRLPYKVSRSRRYWPGVGIRGRIERLLKEFSRILSALQREIEDIPLVLPAPASVRSLSELKRYEDALDALVSAWVGLQFLCGRAEGFGDDIAAIWCPVQPALAQ